MLKCPYCSNEAEFVTGAIIYPHRSDLHAKKFWACMPCAAWVGCHPGTENPLGRLAKAELRKLKSAAHACFDPLWRSGKMSRKAAYASLAAFLGIPSNECHIGMFDEAMCRRVIITASEIIEALRNPKESA